MSKGSKLKYSPGSDDTKQKYTPRKAKCPLLKLPIESDDELDPNYSPHKTRQPLKLPSESVERNKSSGKARRLSRKVHIKCGYEKGPDYPSYKVKRSTLKFPNNQVNEDLIKERRRKLEEFEKFQSNASLRQPRVLVQKYVIRPAPLPPPPKHVFLESGKNHPLEHQVWLHIFKYLSQRDLCVCLRVCKTWNRWCINAKLWQTLNLNRAKLQKEHLIGIVRRQPKKLDLSWTNISKRQLVWLAERLPRMKHLVLVGSSWAAVCGLCSSVCPVLFSLDLSWVDGIHDACIKDLVSPPIDHRPGINESVSRLHQTQSLTLSGSDISDAALETIVQNMTSLTKLNLSYCAGLTDIGISTLCNPESALIDLDLTGCHKLTDNCFRYLEKLTNLESVHLQSCPNISLGACRDFIEQHPLKHAFQMREPHHIEIVK